MSNPFPPLSEILRACEQLRLTMSEQQQQIADLTRENEKLREENARLTAERKMFWNLSGQLLAEEAARNEAQIEAEIAEAMKNGTDFGEFLREMESEFSVV